MTSIEVLREDALTHIRLARPAEGNALDLAMAAEIEGAVAAAMSDDTRVILVSAAGPLFCGGGDVVAMSTADDPASYTLALANSLHRSLLMLAESGLVVVAAVQGAAAGAGFGLVLNADYVIASENATFITAYAHLGVSPDGGTSRLLPLVVGQRRAAALALAGHRLDAPTAREWGIVNDVVPADELAEVSASVARAIARTPADALAATKRLLTSAWVTGYDLHLRREAESIAELMASDESRALQETFLARRR